MTPQEIKQRAVEAAINAAAKMHDETKLEDLVEVAIAAYEKAMWVKVEDGFPPINDQCLLHHISPEFNFTPKGQWDDTKQEWRYTMQYLNGGRYTNKGDGDSGVTHWRPLPTFEGEE